jgi:hypothetical protein
VKLHSSQSIRDSRRFLFSLFAITIVLGLVTVLFSDGFRYGLYSDDYSHKEWAYDLEQGRWQPRLELEQPYLRPIGQVIVFNLANALPDQELLVRLLWAGVHISNVLLASSFAYRLTKSRLVFVVTGGFLLFPIPAHEALFWHSGAASALLGTLLALISVHLLLGAVSADRNWKWYAALGLVVYGLIPQFYEQAATCLSILPLLVFVQRPISRKRILRALLIFLVAVGLLYLHWFFILRHSDQVTVRGVELPSLNALLSERLPRMLQGTSWKLYRAYEFSGFVSAWELGIRRVLAFPPTVLAVPLAAIGATTAVMIARRQERRCPFHLRRTLVLFMVGCVWFCSALVPALVTRNQVTESRMLYYLWVGLSFALSAGVVLLTTKLRRYGSYALAILLGCFFALQIPIMAGFGQVYKLRYEHDQRQLAALASAVPHLPQGPVFLLPWQLDENFVTVAAPGHEILERFLFGVFQTDWSAASSMRMQYRNLEVYPVTSSRWRKLDFEGIRGEGTEAELLINGRVLPVNRTLAFSYRDGRVVIYAHIVVKLQDGHIAKIELPLGREVAAPGVTFKGLTFGLNPDQLLGEEVAKAEAFGDLISLTGYSLQDSQPPGADMPAYQLVTRWSCQDSIPADFTLYVHYLDAAGDRVAQDDHLLGKHEGRHDQEGTLPTSQWNCPGYYEDVSFIPRELVEEEGLEVAFGLWIPQTNEHLQPSGELPVDQFGRVLIDVEKLEQAK